MKQIHETLSKLGDYQRKAKQFQRANNERINEVRNDKLRQVEYHELMYQGKELQLVAEKHRHLREELEKELSRMIEFDELVKEGEQLTEELKKALKEVKKITN